MKTLLLVEDDKMLRHMLKDNLERENFIIFEAANAHRALEISARQSVDLILLDLGLPDSKGQDIIGKIKENCTAPIIILSGQHDKNLIIGTLSAGVDDYITKPCDPDILIARINMHLKKHQESNENNKCPDEKISFNNWTLDRTKFQIFDQKNTSANLTAREFFLLETLVTQPNTALKRQDLCESIREENYLPTPRAIDVKITRIRKKIGDDAQNPRIIKTVRGIGYMFAKEDV